MSAPARLPGDRLTDFLYATPALVALALLSVAPLLLVAGYSFLDIAPDGTLRGFTFSNYRRALDPLYLSVLVYSARLAVVTTMIALVVGYPCALALRSFSPRWRVWALALIIVPSWLNLLIKNYSWIVLLRREGAVNTVLEAARIIDSPLTFLFSDSAILIGLVHTYLPFMILPLYAAVERMDWTLMEAARDLGARPWQQFRAVILPQTRMGAVAGIALVSIPAFGAFVTAELLGGSRNMMIANLIENQVIQVRDWPFASALSMFLIVLVMLAVFLLLRLQENREPLL